jgi:hypothetical protein
MGTIKYRLLIALLAGVGFVCLVSLLLRVPFGLFFALFLATGAIPLALLSNSVDAYPIFALVLSNVLFYSAFSFLWLSLPTLSQKLRRTSPRSLSIKLGSTTIVLIVLACIPALNPLWPHDMKELREEQHDLNLALPAGISLDEAQEVLRTRKFDFFDESVTRDPKGHRLYGRTHTDAWNFPCGFDRIVDLQFGSDGKLENRDVRLLPICP